MLTAPSAAPPRPTVVVVDDAAELRALVRARLRVSDQLEVVGEGASGAEAVELVRVHAPDLLLMDVSMPGMDGLEALPLVRDASPATVVVMFSGFEEQGLADRALDLGAAAYLQKCSSLDTLPAELTAVLRRGAAGAAGVERPEHPHVEPLLEQHVERFREVFDDAAIGMATLTLSGRIVRANASLSHLLDRDPSVLVGLPYADLTDLGDRGLERALGRVVEGGEDVVELGHGLACTPSRRLQATLTPVRDARNRPLYVLVQVQDMTRQREADEALRSSEQRFRLLVETVQDYAIFMLDPDGHIDSWNAGAARTKGYTAEEIVGQHFRVFYPPEVQRSGHPERELELAVRDGRYEEEGWRVRKDGSRFWAQVTITAVHDETGRLVGFAKVTRDVTERHAFLENQERSARALAEANERLKKVADEQARFLAVTAHELRGPLGTMGMSADMLQRHWAELLDDERGALLQGMVDGAAQLDRLLTDLLTVSRAQAHSLDLRPQRVEVLRHLKGLAAGRAKRDPQAEVVLEGEDAVVLADPGRLTQAMDNLVTNALRHGRAPVRVQVTPRLATVEIAVTDAGDGVDPEMVPRLFGRFATGSAKGTGLGLHIVRELARAHGGEASYRSEDGAFVLELPRYDAVTAGSAEGAAR
ncbi:PAS domain S-box protein [Nocardioides sp. dk4132]|uniref:PAS domain S-box protein n=1 Tax=unclassified Nocardioides TaxID=2615069 RepID=UPI0012967CC0|nr:MULTISPECIES: PAS domain S-box protein [unclassified Nocardioides]MQW75410.1 PAS domain S-box protein [Nocardioides sp. dk4132]QGA08334.1 PAS domain S-box protein [Nocardioides sp. dk884]